MLWVRLATGFIWFCYRLRWSVSLSNEGIKSFIKKKSSNVVVISNDDVFGTTLSSGGVSIRSLAAWGSVEKPRFSVLHRRYLWMPFPCFEVSLLRTTFPLSQTLRLFSMTYLVVSENTLPLSSSTFVSYGILSSVLSTGALMVYI
jgi:hypothetical protein